MPDLLRTDAVDLDQDFEYVGEVTKSWVDERTGKRYIVGAASGLEEDRDGERMSKRAIDNMVAEINGGGVKVTAGTHDQTWMTEIGDVVKGEVDPDTDQLMITTELPPEGHDPIADKAWTETHKRQMGWSVGGKLLSAFHELTETGKKRKVLDLVRPKHICLTDKPAYAPSFAHAVAKTWDGEEPAEDDFKDPTVAKDTTTGSWVPGGGGNSGQDSATGSKRNAGTRKPGEKGMSVEDDNKDEPQDDDDEQTVEPTERHMSCPQCGHEFAADIPVDMTPEEREAADQRKAELEDHVPGDDAGDGKPDGEKKPGEDADSKPDEDDEDEEKRPPKSTSKTKEAPVDLEKRMSNLEAAVAKLSGEPETPAAPAAPAVEKTDPEAPAEVAKRAGVDEGTLRLVAVATGQVDDRVEAVRKDVAEGFEIVGKAVMEIREALGALPAGRKSVSHAQVLKRGLEDTGEDSVEKRIEELGEDASPTDILKMLNESTYGITA